jgi:ribose/xylose/arabinose/galactoside ABC-type transport system permease subunit
MSVARLVARLRAGGNVAAIAIFVVMAAVFYVVPTLNGKDVELSSVYSAMQTYAAYGLLALALGVGMIASQFDLSTLGMFALGGMLAVKTGGDSAIVGVLIAAGVGAVAGFVQGSIVARLRLNSMSVTLGGYLVLLGLTQALGDNQSVPYANVNLGIDLDKPIAEILSWHSIIVLAFFLLVGLILLYTRIGRDIRAIGGDERASRVAAVRVDATLIGVFVASGMLAGIAGALNSFSLASALPNPGFAPLVFGATAALIGGVAFEGGRGTAFGIALGAIALSLLQAMFGLLASPEWVSSVVTGALLALAAATAAPRLREHWKMARARIQTRKSIRANGQRSVP